MKKFYHLNILEYRCSMRVQFHKLWKKTTTISAFFQQDKKFIRKGFSGLTVFFMKKKELIIWLFIAIRAVQRRANNVNNVCTVKSVDARDLLQLMTFFFLSDKSLLWVYALESLKYLYFVSFYSSNDLWAVSVAI